MGRDSLLLLVVSLLFNIMFAISATDSDPCSSITATNLQISGEIAISPTHRKHGDNTVSSQLANDSDEPIIGMIAMDRQYHPEIPKDCAPIKQMSEPQPGTNEPPGTWGGPKVSATTPPPANTQQTNVPPLKGLNYMAAGYSEPPNSAICVGKQYVVHGVNNAWSIYRKQRLPEGGGTLVSLRNWTMTSFFGRTSYGFPGCIYDDDTKSFFLAGLSSNNSISIGVFPDGWDLRESHNFQVPYPSVPYFPQIGADRYSFWVSTNQVVESAFIGAYLVGFDKYAMAKGEPVTGHGIQPTFDSFGYQALMMYALRPQVPQPGSTPDTGNGGTIYFLSVNPYVKSDVVVSAVTGTSSIGRGLSPTLHNFVLSTEVIGAPVPEVTEPDNKTLATPDYVVRSATYGAGRLYGLANTVGQGKGVGIAYFVIEPLFVDGYLRPKLLFTGVLSDPKGNSLAYPSVGVAPSGSGAIGFSYSGPTAFPSVGYFTFTEADGIDPEFKVAVVGTENYNGSSWGLYTCAQYDDSTGMVFLSSWTAKDHWTSYIVPINVPDAPALALPPPSSSAPSPGSAAARTVTFRLRYPKCCQWKKTCQRSKGWRFRCSFKDLQQCSQVSEVARSEACKACLQCASKVTTATMTLLDVIRPPTNPENACFVTRDTNGDPIYKICRVVNYQCSKLIANDVCTPV